MNAGVRDAAREALDAGQAQPVAEVRRDGATVRLEWVSVEAAHNAKPGPLYTAPQASQPVAPDAAAEVIGWAVLCDDVPHSLSMTETAAHLKAEVLRLENRGRDFHIEVAPLFRRLPAPAAQPLTECADNDSPWLVCRPCAAAGQCAKASQPVAPASAWLVEWRFNGVQWLYLWPLAPGGFSFTGDANRAIRFARREDAEATLKWAREVDRKRGVGRQSGEMLVTEHEWAEPGALSAAPPAPAAQPLTEEQITEGWRETWLAVPSSATAFRDGVRFAERAHGIRSET